MALYAIIQFTNVVLLTFNGAFLGNWQYLYQDLWVVFPLVVLMGRSKAANSLSKKVWREIRKKTSMVKKKRLLNYD
jgi:cation-transporting P-type ATPase 13A2